MSGLVTIVLLGLGVAGCGGASSSGHPDRRLAVAYFEGDHDVDDFSHSQKDPDDNSVRYFGHAASPVDRQALVLLVKRYYTVAAAEEGTAGCSLISSRLSKDPGLGDLAERAYPPAPGAESLPGQSCVRIMSLLFKEAHARFAADAAGLTVTSARVKGHGGRLVLGFRSTPERYIEVERENGVWKMGSLLDKELL